MDKIDWFCRGRLPPLFESGAALEEARISSLILGRPPRGRAWPCWVRGDRGQGDACASSNASVRVGPSLIALLILEAPKGEAR
jgi:hypothetical protein